MGFACYMSSQTLVFFKAVGSALGVAPPLVFLGDPCVNSLFQSSKSHFPSYAAYCLCVAHDLSGGHGFHITLKETESHFK